MMKYAADFRSIARNALKGKWGIAVVAGLIASLLGAIGSSGPKLNVELNDGNIGSDACKDRPEFHTAIGGNHILSKDLQACVKITFIEFHIEFRSIGADSA